MPSSFSARACSSRRDEHRDVRDLGEVAGEEAADHAGAGDADALGQAVAPWTSATNSSSSTSPRLRMPSSLTAVEQVGVAAPRARRGRAPSALIRIESSPLFLPSTIAALGRDELRRVRLDRRRVVELARDRAALAAVERLAGHRLPRLELVAGQLPHARRDRADQVEPQVRLDAVERAQRQRDLAEVRVAGALAHAVDRPLHVRGARAHRRDGARRRDAEVVVAVEVHRHVRPDELDGRADELRDRLGRGDAERVDDHDLARARLDRARVDAAVEVALGARRVDAEERGVDAVARRRSASRS